MSESTTSQTRYVDKETAVEETFRPEWARVQEAAQRIGIKSSRFYELLTRATAPSALASSRVQGAERGPRLIYLPSLFVYLDKVAAEQAQAPAR
jgi:hypothetical protein